MSAISELSSIKVDKAQTPEEKRAQRKEAGRDNKAGYLFLLPWLIGLVVITIGPLLASLYLSFTRYSLIQAPEWIGIDNYLRMLTDARLHKSLQGHVHLRDHRRAAAVDRGPGHRHLVERGHEGTAVLPVGVLPAVHAGGLGRDRGVVAADVRRRRPGQPGTAGGRHQLHRSAGSPTRTTRCGR